MLTNSKLSVFDEEDELVEADEAAPLSAEIAAVCEFNCVIKSSAAVNCCSNVCCSSARRACSSVILC